MKYATGLLGTYGLLILSLMGLANPDLGNWSTVMALGITLSISLLIAIHLSAMLAEINTLKERISKLEGGDSQSETVSTKATI